MTEYLKVSIGLSEKQRKGIAQAIEAGSGVRIRLSHTQLYEKNITILATQTQSNRIERAKREGKGIMLTLSKRQLDKMKSGGFLPMLLGALVSSLAPILFNKIFPDKNEEGSGINMPGTGINLPRGQGFITPDNGGDTSYHIEGFSARNAGQGANAGSGMVLPGSKSNRSQSKKAATLSAERQAGPFRDTAPQQAHGMMREPPVKKKRQTRTLNQIPVGMGYIQPNSQTFQMLE